MSCFCGLCVNYPWFHSLVCAAEKMQDVWGLKQSKCAGKAPEVMLAGVCIKYPALSIQTWISKILWPDLSWPLYVCVLHWSDQDQ